MEVQNLSAKYTGGTFALVYGGSGTGKTDLCGTLGELGKVLIIDIDMGGLTILNSPRVKPHHPNICMVSFDKFGDLDSAYKLCQKNDPAEWKKVLGDDYTFDEPFDWVVWDSWSELQWNMLQELRKNENLLTAGGKLNFRKNIGIQHWGMLTDLNKLSIESLRDVSKTTGLNQVFVMLETMSKDELSGQVFGGPAIHGKLVNEFPGYFNIVVHTYTDLSGKYCVSTKSKGRWPAKTRLGNPVDGAGYSAKDLFVAK